MANNKSITFGGHFAVGEKPTETERETLERAISMGGDIGVLVNDIDVKKKILYYSRLGRDTFFNHYGQRVKCGTTTPICSLPDADSLPERVDWDFYEHAKEVLTAGPQYTSSQELDSVCNDLINDYIQERLKDVREVQIYKEKSLRNYASHRLSAKKGFDKTWKEIIDPKEIDEVFARGTDKRPQSLCRGIMLGLYEKLDSIGYDHVVQFYGAEDKIPVTKAVELYQKVSERFSAWNLTFQNYFVQDAFSC
jgi:hypothetical protein